MHGVAQLLVDAKAVAARSFSPIFTVLHYPNTQAIYTLSVSNLMLVGCNAPGAERCGQQVARVGLLRMAKHSAQPLPQHVDPFLSSERVRPSASPCPWASASA